MSDYRKRLAALSPEGCLLAPADCRLILLTGQSSFASSALSPAQREFLSAVSPTGASIVDAGFPFHQEFHGGGFAETGLIGASVRNAAQVIWSRTSIPFRHSVARRLQRAIDTTRQRLLLLTGSCGLQLANAVWPDLRIPHALRIDAVALGPACFGPLQLDATVIQGRQDIWSRLFYRGPVHHLSNCAHLDYWTSTEVRDITRKLLQ